MVLYHPDANRAVGMMFHVFSAVIVRLVRNCALERTIQYSRDGGAWAEAPLEYWMPRRSLSSGARSRDPLAGHDNACLC